MTSRQRYAEYYGVEEEFISCETCRWWRRDKGAEFSVFIKKCSGGSRQDKIFYAPCAVTAIQDAELEHSVACLTAADAYCGDCYEDLYEPTWEALKEMESARREWADIEATYKQLRVWLAKQF